VEEPHSGIAGINQGNILNLTAKEASRTRDGILKINSEIPEKIIDTYQQLKMPSHHDVTSKDVNLKRLGSILWLAHEHQPKDFESLLLLQGVGPRTIQSLALVSEIIHGTPTRFKDPARFSFAHGGKDGHPFPVPLKVYDETIQTLHNAVHKAKIGVSEKNIAIKKLHEISSRAEKNFMPDNNLDSVIEKERNDSWKYGGKTVFGDAKPSLHEEKNIQLRLF
jgi:hypothetical protein